MTADKGDKTFFTTLNSQAQKKKEHSKCQM